MIGVRSVCSLLDHYLICDKLGIIGPLYSDWASAGLSPQMCVFVFSLEAIFYRCPWQRSFANVTFMFRVSLRINASLAKQAFSTQ